MINFDLIKSPPKSPILEGDGVRLRAAQLTDYAVWSRLREMSRAHLTRWEPDWTDRDSTLEAFRTRIRLQERVFRSGAAIALLAFRKTSGELIGGVTLSDIRQFASRSATIGYWIGEPHLRKGYGAASVKLVLDYGLCELRLNRIEAACQPGNLASRRLLEKLRFREEGLARDFLFINGEWRDHALFAVTARDYCGAPPEVSPTARS
jgi:ribosomal-protein-alanine N-acetyltransferase